MNLLQCLKWNTTIVSYRHAFVKVFSKNPAEEKKKATRDGGFFL